MTDGEVRALVAVAEALKGNADAIKAAIETFKTPALYAPLVSMGK